MGDREKKTKFPPTSIYKLKWRKLSDCQTYLAENFEKIGLSWDRNEYDFEVQFYRRKTTTSNWLAFVMKDFIEDEEEYVQTYDTYQFILTAVNNNKKLKSAFAICSGHVYHKISPFVDTNFSVPVGKKILNPKNVTRTKSRFLQGQIISSDKSFHADRKGRNLPSITSDIFCSVDGLQAQVSDDLKGDFLSHIRSRLVTVHTHSLKIIKSLSVKEMFKVLADLSRVQDMELDDKEEFSFMNHVVPVKDSKLKSALDDCLENVIKHNKEEALKDFYVCPENYKQWQICEKFRLYQQKRKAEIHLKTWSHPPDIRNVANLLRDKEISNIKMKYYVDGHWCRGEKILNFIQGYTLYERNYYFHRGKRWFTVHVDYVRKMEEEFFQLLKDKLKLKLSDGALPLPWCSKKADRFTTKADVDRYIQFCKKVLRKNVSDTQEQMIRKLFPSGALLVDKNTTTSYKNSGTKIISQLGNGASRRMSGNNSDDEEEISDSDDISDDGTGTDDENDSNDQSSSIATKSTAGAGRKRRSDSSYISPKKKQKLLSNIEEDVEYNLYAKCFTEIDEDEYNSIYYVCLNQLLLKPDCDLSTDLGVDPESQFPKYLLGDKILVHNHSVELFDLLKITRDTLYLYHVKDKFGHKTRDAVSQIRDSASLLHKEVFARNKTILQEWYDTVINYQGNDKTRIKLRHDLKQCDKQDFIDLFLEKKIVYVYAFTDEAKKRKSIADLVFNDKHLMLTKKHLCDALGVKQGNDKVETLCDVLISNKIISSSGTLFKVEKHFRNLKKKDIFEILRRKDRVFHKRREKIVNTLHRHFLPSALIRSYIGKFELLRLAHDFKTYYPQFELIFCEIKKPLD